MGTPQSNLPPGFRFHPTDEELILHYLKKKVASLPLPVSIIAEVDIYKFDPWVLPGKAVFGEKEWYFFSPRDRKYPNGVRPNRTAGSGYWKATGTDKNIVASISLPAAQGGGGVVQGQNIGVKKALVFYTGKAPKGVKTNWIMHEYRLVQNNNNKALKLKDSSMRLDDWVLCRIYKKPRCTTLTLSSSTTEAEAEVGDQQDQKAEVQKLFIKDNTTLLPFSKSTPPSSSAPPPQKNTLKSQKSLSFANLLLDANDYSMLSSFLSENHSDSNFNSNPLTGIIGPSGTAGGSSYDQNLVQESSSQNTTTIISNSYLFQKNLLDLQLNLNPSVPSSNMENMMIIRPNNINKRPFSDIDDENMLQYPSKKYLSASSSCNLPNTNPQYENPQWNLNIEQSLFNQHLLLGPHPQFQG